MPMQVNFTKEDLVRLIYRETNAAETLDILGSLDEDVVLLAEYERLIESYQQLPKVMFYPSSKTVQDVLEYSKHTTLV